MIPLPREPFSFESGVHLPKIYKHFELPWAKARIHIINNLDLNLDRSRSGVLITWAVIDGDSFDGLNLGLSFSFYIHGSLEKICPD